MFCCLWPLQLFQPTGSPFDHVVMDSRCRNGSSPTIVRDHFAIWSEARPSRDALKSLFPVHGRLWTLLFVQEFWRSMFLFQSLLVMTTHADSSKVKFKDLLKKSKLIFLIMYPKGGHSCPTPANIPFVWALRFPVLESYPPMSGLIIECKFYWSLSFDSLLTENIFSPLVEVSDPAGIAACAQIDAVMV